MTDENGEIIPETEPAGEEVVPYDDGLGLPDTVAGGGQTPGEAASETLSETPPAPGTRKRSGRPGGNRAPVDGMHSGGPEPPGTKIQRGDGWKDRSI